MGELIPNHLRYQRQVIFDKNHQVTMVQSARRSPPGTTTFQLSEKQVAAYKLTSKFSKDGEPFSIFQVKEILLTQGEEYFSVVSETWGVNSIKFSFKDFDVWIGHESIANNKKLIAEEIHYLLRQIPNPVYQYLLGYNKPNHYYNLIPEGYGWDGKHTNIELVRANKIKQILIGNYEWRGIDETLINKICDETPFTPNRLINTSWDKAYRYQDGEKIFLKKTNSDSEIFIIGQNNELSELLDISLATSTDGVKFFIPDKRYHRYVCVVTNILTQNGHPNYGVTIKLYERNDHDEHAN